MKISILTLFPDLFNGPFDLSIIKRAKDNKKVAIQFINIRDYSQGRYKSVDDRPYGGGQGMILKVDVVDRALQSIKDGKKRIILLDPRGATYTQKKAKSLSKLAHIVLICGHYEGVDERIRKLVDEEISIGNYIVTGGEIPAMVLVDSVVRLLPGVLKNATTTSDESFSKSARALEYPQYTRPRTYKSVTVPRVLVSGDHNKIAQWKIKHTKTQKRSSP